MTDLIYWYIGLAIGLIINISAFALSVLKKENIWSWLIVINFVVFYLFPNDYDLIIPVVYLLYLLYRRIFKNEQL